MTILEAWFMPLQYAILRFWNQTSCTHKAELDFIPMLCQSCSRIVIYSSALGFMNHSLIRLVSHSYVSVVLLVLLVLCTIKGLSSLLISYIWFSWTILKHKLILNRDIQRNKTFSNIISGTIIMTHLCNILNGIDILS